jgi:hypothetical protein
MTSSLFIDKFQRQRQNNCLQIRCRYIKQKDQHKAKDFSFSNWKDDVAISEDGNNMRSTGLFGGEWKDNQEANFGHLSYTF